MVRGLVLCAWVSLTASSGADSHRRRSIHRRRSSWDSVVSSTTGLPGRRRGLPGLLPPPQLSERRRGVPGMPELVRRRRASLPACEADEAEEGALVNWSATGLPDFSGNSQVVEPPTESAADLPLSPALLFWLRAAPAFVAAVRAAGGVPSGPELLQARDSGNLLRGQHERYQGVFRAWEEIYGADGYIRRRRRLVTSPSTPEWLRQLGLRRASEWTRPWEEGDGVLIGDPGADPADAEDATADYFLDSLSSTCTERSLASATTPSSDPDYADIYGDDFYEDDLYEDCHPDDMEEVD